MPDAIAARGLGRDFDGLPAVRNLDLAVREGEMFVLVGPDGAGKTTTIRMLCGLVRPTAGRAEVLGLDPAAGSEAFKAGIGYLSQRFSLYGDLTVDENIEFFAEIHGVRDFRARREELLAFTRLAPFRGRLGDALSGGMRQKLALACTLVHAPRVIFLDEPTTGVDPVSRRDFWKILSSLLASGITIFMSTPYLDEAERASRVALMNAGALLAVGTPREIKSLMKGEVVEIVCPDVRRAYRLLKDLPDLGGVQLFGDRLNVVVADAAAEGPRLAALLEAAGLAGVSARPIPPSLENVFISVMPSASPGG